MRISILVSNNIRQDQRMKKISLVLAEMGFDVELVGRKIYPNDHLELSDRKVHLLKLPFNSGVLFYLSYAIYSFLYLLRTRPQIIYSVDCDTLLPAILYKIIFGKKLIYDAHELFDQVPELDKSPMKRKIWRALESWGSKHALLNIAVAPTIAGILSDRNKVPFQIIRNLSSKPKVHINHNNYDKKILLYQGMLNEGRGLEFIIESMEYLEAWHLWIIGNGDLEQALISQASKSSARDRIKFYGFIDPENLPELTRQATWGLNILDDRSKSYFLSLANRTFDYLAAGLPAIHMAFPEYQHLQNEYQCFRLLDKMDRTTFIKIIEQTNEEEYLHIKENSKKAMEQLNWEHESIRLKELFQAALTTGKSPS